MKFDVWDEIRRSRAGLQAQIEEYGVDFAIQTRMRRLCESGDMALLLSLGARRTKDLSHVLLSPINQPEIDVTRGQIMGVRNILLDFVDAARDPNEDQEGATPPEESLNPFESIEDEGSPLEIGP